jgi:UTP--glucose-1-phosphate uridylyltransferase
MGPRLRTNQLGSSARHRVAGIAESVKGRRQVNKPIRKAVLPVGGLGTRLLPATKTIPKEMLPIVDRPILQHVIDEAREAGVEEFIFVTGRNKSVIEDYFDTSYELEDILRRGGKTRERDALIADLPKAGFASFTRQHAPLGLGHAVWCARKLVGAEPFALLLPDMVTMAGARGDLCLGQCVEAYAEHGGNIIAVEEVPYEKTCHYGVVGVGADFGHAFEIKGIIEKPTKGTAPSNLIISGRYILQPEIFDVLETLGKGTGGEIQITDGMIKLAASQVFHGVRFDGQTYNCGSKLGLLSANIAFALNRPDLAAELRAAIRKLAD